MDGSIHTFTFRLFYRVRRALSVQFEMLVLLVVEIVSTGYYRVIRQHVGDAPIADMCKLILRDEARHIDFHCARIAAGPSFRFPALWAMRIHLLAEACAWFLWLGHGRCLRALGGTRKELFRHVRRGVVVFLRKLAGARNPDSSEGRRQLVRSTASASSVGRVPARVQAPSPAR